MVMTEQQGIPSPATGSVPGGGSAPAPGDGFVDDVTYTIEWDETTPYKGLQVVFAPPSIGEYIQLLIDPEAGALTTDDDDLSATGEQRMFARCLRSWNVKNRAGEPVPATLAGFLSLSRPLSRAIVQRWIRETAEVPAPLDGPSISGEISELESLQTDP